MIVSLLCDFVLGFLLHKTRPWTMQFEGRIPDLVRYTIGLTGFIVMAPFNILHTLKNSKCHRYWCMYENIFVGMLLTALAYGAGVVVGYVVDTE